MVKGRWNPHALPPQASLGLFGAKPYQGHREFFGFPRLPRKPDIAERSSAVRGVELYAR